MILLFCLLMMLLILLFLADVTDDVAVACVIVFADFDVVDAC